MPPASLPLTAASLPQFSMTFVVPTARPAMRTYVPSTLSTYRYLQQGSRGSDVTKLQQRLKDLGYFSGSVNGSFGADTETAVRAFQKRNGLWEDGVAGEDTQRMLYSNNALAASR